MKKTALLSVIALCSFTLRAADTKEDLKRQLADQQRKEAKEIVNQFTDEQKQEAFVCMLLGVDTMNILEGHNVDQSMLKQLTHPEGELAQKLRPLNFDTYQIIARDGLADEDRVAAYASLSASNIYHASHIALQQATADVEIFNSGMLYALVEVQDVSSSEDFNQVCKAHIKRLITMHRMHKEHNVLPLTQEKFDELFDKNVQWNSLEKSENCTAIQKLTEALNEQQENSEHENSLIPVYKQAFDEMLEGFMKIHSL